MNRRLANAHGFTLVELLIVTVVVGLLAQGMTTIRMSILPRMRVRQASRQLGWDLLKARMQAVKQNQPIAVRFMDDTTYTIWADSNANGMTDLGEDVTKVVNLGDDAPGVTMAADTPFPFTVTYNTRGRPNTPITLNIANDSGTKTITLGLAGHVELP